MRILASIWPPKRTWKAVPTTAGPAYRSALVYSPDKIGGVLNLLPLETASWQAFSDHHGVGDQKHPMADCSDMEKCTGTLWTRHVACTASN